MGADLSPLTVSGLTKTYSKRTAVKDINLKLKRGEVFGLLGPSGAGKSTLIRVALNFARPTSGSVKIFGVDSTTDNRDIMRVTGYLPDRVALYENMTGKQLLHYLSSLRKNTDREYTNDLSERLKATLDKPIQYLPPSEQQKIGLIQALMSKPELAILDEPTKHLDRVTKQILYDIIKQTRLDGRTVLLTSSDLYELQRTSQRIGFMRNGEMVAVQEVDRLGKMNFREYIVRFSVTPSNQELANLPGIINFTTERNQARLTISGQVGDFLRELSRYSVVDLESDAVNLENVFMHYYKQPEGGIK